MRWGSIEAPLGDPEISREKASALAVYLADGTNRICAWRPHTTALHPTVPKWMQLSLPP